MSPPPSTLSPGCQWAQWRAEPPHSPGIMKWNEWWEVGLVGTLLSTFLPLVSTAPWGAELMRPLEGSEVVKSILYFRGEVLRGPRGELNFHAICLQGGSENQLSAFAGVVSVEPREELYMPHLQMGTAC